MKMILSVDHSKVRPTAQMLKVVFGVPTRKYAEMNGQAAQEKWVAIIVAMAMAMVMNMVAIIVAMGVVMNMIMNMVVTMATAVVMNMAMAETGTNLTSSTATQLETKRIVLLLEIAFGVQNKKYAVRTLADVLEMTCSLTNLIFVLHSRMRPNVSRADYAFGARTNHFVVLQKTNVLEWVEEIFVRILQKKPVHRPMVVLGGNE